MNLSRGLYYIEIVISAPGVEDPLTYYSDIFFVDTREELARNSIKLEWWNNENLETFDGLVPYGEAGEDDEVFHGELYLDSDIGMPTYNFTEEGEERNGLFYPTKQISEKTYNMSLVAPEYLCDVMRQVRMADNVTITDRLAREYRVEQFEMEVTWLEQGHYASVECSFQTDTIIKKIGKAY